MDSHEEEPFSETLQNWLKSDEEKTVGSLGTAFSEKSFALTFFILMALPALPLPTGGLTHIFEIITMLLALELIALRRSIWLPEKWKNKAIGKNTQTKMIPALAKIIRRTERFSKPRMSGFLESALARVGFGISTLIFAIAAFAAPPFSGLDTPPSLGVIIVSLGFILEDVVVVIAGFILGIVGVGITIALGAALFSSIGNLFS